MRRDSFWGLRRSQRRLLKGVRRTRRGLNRCRTTGMASRPKAASAQGARRLTDMLPPRPGASGQVGGQGRVVGLPRADRVIVNADVGEALAIELAQLADSLHVEIAHRG